MSTTIASVCMLLTDGSWKSSNKLNNNNTHATQQQLVKNEVSNWNSNRNLEFADSGGGDVERRRQTKARPYAQRRDPQLHAPPRRLPHRIFHRPPRFLRHRFRAPRMTSGSSHLDWTKSLSSHRCLQVNFNCVWWVVEIRSCEWKLWARDRTI